ncbi:MULTISPECIES: RdgB/HAM1 family non-canonical purine NTP pyrophosphatase [Piscirickettsiaceae]|jgi:XTP/dITP diphosphohydrolase|uniref:dITP/XTP pyrophosphatase n=1 Tax=Hydrogenovibrio thermophilus TaxID=265883 RepID=A0A410H4I6_9GAMM|nr:MULTISPECIES: RdgB/HAM1 family non-canonical purine NTP pyrophosphatase [Piscirickettsiaceae]AZR81670.1 non-canonical purine NTP pyrophosphatase [Thiomicrospira sp. S5]QAB15807.1 RdgB/HAM1 family non-canonical purine NTP pyrophosphatase [Hydrogenovibrio thermophilus]
MERLVLATGNPYKVAEMAPVLRQYGVEPLAQSTFFDGEVEEDGLSFVENALKKARFASAKSGLPALADDSGLEVASLGGLPGIISARYASQGSHKPTEAENVRQLLDDLDGRDFSERKARYSCAVVYVSHECDPMPVIGIGHWYGEILKSPRTGQGIGYDDVMWIPALVKTVSELPLDEKIRLSHRTQAIHSVMTQLETNAFYD